MSHPLSGVPQLEQRVAEREALEEMVGTEGWQVFLRYVSHEWRGAGFHSRLTTAFSRNDADAKVLHRASLEIIRLFEWPKNRIAELKGQADE